MDASNEKMFSTFLASDRAGCPILVNPNLPVHKESCCEVTTHKGVSSVWWYTCHQSCECGVMSAGVLVDEQFDRQERCMAFKCGVNLFAERCVPDVSSKTQAAPVCSGSHQRLSSFTLTCLC